MVTTAAVGSEAIAILRKELANTIADRDRYAELARAKREEMDELLGQANEQNVRAADLDRAITTLGFMGAA